MAPDEPPLIDPPLLIEPLPAPPELGALPPCP
jgi:hypothetical protein